MTDILKKLAVNSQIAIDDGVYDVDVQLDRSSRNLQDEITLDHPTIIAEIKFGSPALGKIRTLSDPALLARQMVAGGAKALSVLTQPHLFSGSPEYFVKVREATDVPLLMKDIIIDRVQVDAAQKMGADYILLIQALFDGRHASGMNHLIEYGHKKGLGVLLETHTAREFEQALGTGADLVGINNRNLDTLEIDLDTTRNILEGYNGPRHIISESGIMSPSDVRYLHECGASMFLIGSSIMLKSDITSSVNEMVCAY